MFVLSFAFSVACSIDDALRWLMNVTDKIRSQMRDSDGRGRCLSSPRRVSVEANSARKSEERTGRMRESKLTRDTKCARERR